MDEKILLQVKKILFKKIKALPQNKRLPYREAHDLIHLYFVNNLEEEDYEKAGEYLTTVVDNSVNKQYLTLIKDTSLRPAQELIMAGLDFDIGLSELENKNEPSIAINNLNATNVQVGNNNIQNINYSSEDFLSALSSFKDTSPKEKESVLERLSKIAETGGKMRDIINVFIETFS